MISVIGRASFLSFFSAASSFVPNPPSFLRRRAFGLNAFQRQGGRGSSDIDGRGGDDEREDHSIGLHDGSRTNSTAAAAAAAAAGGGLLANMGGRSYNDLTECVVSSGVGGRCDGIGSEGVRVVYDSSFRRCCVCLEEYSEGQELRVLPCAHALHGKCAREWLRRSSCCPYCKAEVQVMERCELKGERRISRHDRDANVELIDYSVTISWSEWIRGFMRDGNSRAD